MNTLTSPEAQRVRRFRVYRFVANLWVYTFLVILGLNVFRLFGAPGRAIAEVLWTPWGIAMYLWAIPWFVISAGFLFGLIRCPLCGRSFGVRFVWVTRTCSSCRRDVLGEPQ